MQCPICNSEMKKGIVDMVDSVHMMQPIAAVDWINTEDAGGERIPLSSDADGYYCSQCRKVFAIFEEE